MSSKRKRLQVFRRIHPIVMKINASVDSEKFGKVSRNFPVIDVVFEPRRGAKVGETQFQNAKAFYSDAPQDRQNHRKTTTNL